MYGLLNLIINDGIFILKGFNTSLSLETKEIIENNTDFKIIKLGDIIVFLGFLTKHKNIKATLLYEEDKSEDGENWQIDIIFKTICIQPDLYLIYVNFKESCPNIVNNVFKVHFNLPIIKSYTLYGYFDNKCRNYLSTQKMMLNPINKLYFHNQKQLKFDIKLDLSSGRQIINLKTGGRCPFRRVGDVLLQIQLQHPSHINYIEFNLQGHIIKYDSIYLKIIDKLINNNCQYYPPDKFLQKCLSYDIINIVKSYNDNYSVSFTNQYLGCLNFSNRCGELGMKIVYNKKIDLIIDTKIIFTVCDSVNYIPDVSLPYPDSHYQPQRLENSKTIFKF
jgi:hypothetical protein